MRKINEIFYSLQGEGRNTGMAAVFVRFSGCNLRCSFCDTDHESGSMMTDEQIVAEVMKYPQAAIIVLTGGEPSLFIDYDFVARLKKETGMKIAIETNGTHPLPDNLDWVTLSPKTGFPGADAAPVVVKKCNELKVVYMGQPLSPYTKEYEAEFYYLQPCDTSSVQQNRSNILATIEAVKSNPQWILSLQTHKFVGIR